MKKNIKFIIAIFLIVIVMTIFINKKEGFHEDEMFSYGSSNYKYDNVYRQYGKMDEVNTLLTTKVISSNLGETVKNFKYYFLDNPEEKEKIIKQIEESEVPIWRTSDEAKEYLNIDKEDILNYPMVYYNQLRDVHPPLFYFLVHTASIVFYGHFSKYIIFIINIIFLILSCISLKKIMEKLNKKHLELPAILLYGLSMGAISTVMFQRMYMVLTFFVLEFLAINLDIINNNYDIDKRTWIKLGIITILGFLTQYYFCIIAVLIALIIFINIIRKKDKNKAIKYIFNYMKIAIIGLLIFPFSIQHIFFSYRGVSSFGIEENYFGRLKEYIELIGYSFSIPTILLIVVILLLIGMILYNLIKSKTKIKTQHLILTIPFGLFIILIAKIAPAQRVNDSLRYIMCVLPIITIVFLMMIDSTIKNKKHIEIIFSSLIIVLSIYGLITSKPMFLYEGYNKYIEIANTYKDDKFVFIGNTVFNQIQNMQEFAIYSESMILNETQIDVLANDEKIKQTDEFILSIKKYLGAENLLNEVLEKTGFQSYEILLDDTGDVSCIIYKIKREK